MVELLPCLGLTANTACHLTYREIELQSCKYFQENNHHHNNNNNNNNTTKTSPVGDSTQVELVKIFLDFCSHLRKNDLVSALRTITEISKLSTENFNVLKSLAQRVFLAKFMIFSHIFLCCYEETKSDVVSLATLSITAREDVITFIKDTVKSLMDSIKRKSTSFFTGSSKNKYQELLDEILHNIYPVYSVCRGYNQPYRVSNSKHRNKSTVYKIHVQEEKYFVTAGDG